MATEATPAGPRLPAEKVSVEENPVEEQNTFVEYLVAGGMRSETAWKLSVFFEMRCWTKLRFIREWVIDDIEGGFFADDNGDLVLTKHELEQLRSICVFYRKGN
jgi:hypothetical protein